MWAVVNAVTMTAKALKWSICPVMMNSDGLQNNSRTAAWLDSQIVEDALMGCSSP
jgi:hypothetical protein